MKKIDGQRNKINIIVSLCNTVLLNGNVDSVDSLLPSLSANELDEMLSLANKHGMLASLMSFFEGRQIDDKELRRVIVKKFATAQKNVLKYQSRVKTVEELASMFAEDGIDMMIFKGVATAQLYPKPEWRMFSDIDFYLYGRCLDGNAAMERYGIKSRPFYHHNTEATLHGILLENHYDFVERMNHRQNLMVDDEMKQLAKEEGKSCKATFLRDGISNVYCMTPTMNAIFLMRHMGAHFASESIALRMLYDWALFLKAYAKDVDWARVCKIYEASGMTEFVELVMGVIKTRLGVEFRDVPVKPVENEKTEKVWESIVFPPESNPHKKYSLVYFVYETKTFFGNKWKHDIVYPGESYFMLSLHYAWSVFKRKTGLLKINVK